MCQVKNNGCYDPNKPVKTIVTILRSYNIPLAGIDEVFQLVKDDIRENTLPYMPNDLKEAGENQSTSAQKNNDP